MLLLSLKVLLAPLLVAAATLAQRRWGATVGGRIVGLPLTAGPLLLLLAISNGPHFTAHVATADQAGDMAASAWCVTYALAARRWRPIRAFAAAGAAFALVAVAVAHLHPSLLLGTLMASVTLVAALLWWPRSVGPAEAREAGGSDLLVRMAVAAVFTLGITESASTLGATVAGLVGALPLVTIVLTVATHHREGGASASQFLQGVMSGSFSVIAFLAVMAVGLPRLGTAATFVIALAASVAAQGIGGRRTRMLGARARRLVRPRLALAS